MSRLEEIVAKSNVEVGGDDIRWLVARLKEAKAMALQYSHVTFSVGDSGKPARDFLANLEAGDG